MKNVTFNKTTTFLILCGLMFFGDVWAANLNLINTRGIQYSCVAGIDAGQFTPSGNDGARTFVAVPEPQTLAMLVGGLGMLASWRRIRRHFR